MCGFFCVFQNSPIISIDAAKAAANTIEHRGPDEAGDWRERHMMLFHHRLSIIDLATGQQPMQSHDGRFVITFNGEIYNFFEIREELRKKGVKFRTCSDTEVLLEGYAYWGSSVVDRLNGMFAFVVWDRLKSKVFGARDRLGIKPLTWATHKGALLVSSTVEPFTVLDMFRRVDPVAVRDLLTFDYIPAPRTIIQNVSKLEPGCRFHWSLGEESVSIERYWSPPLADMNAEAPGKVELEDLLRRAVRRQMISDVPIGVFLSGGIDSSLIVALMAQESAKPISSFSVAFQDREFDESSIAKLVAKEFGTDHTVLQAESLTSDELLDLLGRLDEPFADPTVVVTYALAKMTAKHVKVALSGDGADEVFGGYTKYLLKDFDSKRVPGYRLVDASLRAMPWRPRGMAHLYFRTLPREERIRWSCVKYGDFPIFRKDLRQVLSAKYYQAAQVSDYFEPMRRILRWYGDHIDTDVLMRADLDTYLSENCLVKTDRSTMLASLEVRVPYLDELLLQRVLPLHANKKIIDGRLKALLMPIAQHLLPKQVWDRPKHGFNVPISSLIRNRWRPAIELLLDWGRRNVDMFDYNYLWRLSAISSVEGGIGRELWNPIVVLAWMMKHSLRTS
jgi:asparagine synthase (glutamine-hydrolysing)